MRGGRLKQKAKMEISENENALLGCNDFGPISYEWVFGTSKANYQEQEGVPTVRIMSPMSSIDRAS